MIERHAPRLAAITETEEQVAAWLSRHVGEPVVDVGRVSAGAWSRPFAFSRRGQRFIVRFSALDEDFARDRYAARWNRAALPIPRVVAMGPAADGFFAISERADGGFLDQLDEQQMRAMLPALAALLAALGAADTGAATGFGDLDAAGNGVHATWRGMLLDVTRDRPEQRTHGWKARLEADPARAAIFAEAGSVLEALVPLCPEFRQVIHSDLLNRNVLVVGNRLSAVIDWGCAMYGDALYDLAWLAFWSPWFPRWAGIDFVAELAARNGPGGPDAPHFAERLRCYQVHIGLAGLAYNAYQGRWDFFAETARRTLAITHDDG